MSSLVRRVQKRMHDVGIDSLRRLPRLPRGPPRRVPPPVQHGAHQRHRLLPRPGGLGASPSRSCPALLEHKADGRADPRAGAPAAPRARRPTPSPSCSPRRSATTRSGERVKIYATDVDEDALAQARAGDLHRARRWRASRRRCSPSTSSRRRPLRLPQGPAPLGDLRPPRSDPGRADLAHRPAGLPQHADVLQRRDPGADPRPLPLRAPAARASSSSARPRRCSATATSSAPIDLKHRIFQAPAAHRPPRAAAGGHPGGGAGGRRAGQPHGAGPRGRLRRRPGGADRRRPQGAARARQRARRASCSGWRRPTSAAASRTSRSPIVRPSCARSSRAPACRGRASR